MDELVICEKPNVARKIADALSPLGEVTAKRHKKVQYFVIECKDSGANSRTKAHGSKAKHPVKRIFIAPAVGHLFTLKTDVGNLQYPVFDVYWTPSYENGKKGLGYTKDYVEVLEKLGKDAGLCISACDYDIEGSLIGYNVIRFCCGRKDGKRMKFSTLTKEELFESYKNMHELDLGNAIAGETRHILDWYYGINLSRALMQSIRKAKNWHKIFSIGRVQGPTLSIIVKLEKKIQEFVAKPYYTLTAQLKSTIFEYENERIWDKKEAEALLNKAKGHDANILAVESSQYSQNPFPPFDLTSLQTEAYRVFGFSPSFTLSLAQSLYEKTYISYPRTASQKLPQALKLPLIISKLAKIPDYQNLVAKLTNKSKPIEGKKEDQAHPAIHPTGYFGDMSQPEKKLYDLIVKRFLACFGSPAQREKTKVVADINSLKFLASGIRTLKREWMDIYDYAKFEEASIDLFEKGEKLQVQSVSMHSKMTKPPSRYTQASLIAELEKLNLGTKATRAAIIDTLYDRGYIHGKSIKATTLGINVHDTLIKYSAAILDEELTRQIEDKMEHIADGKTKSDEVLEEGKRIIFDLLTEFKKHEVEIGTQLANGIVQSDKEKNTLGKCNLCGKGDLIVRYSPKTKKKFVGCSSYPGCKNVFGLPPAKTIEATGKVCEHCGTPIIKVVREGRKPFEMCLTFNCKSKESWGKNNKNNFNENDQETDQGSSTPEKKENHEQKK